jgi:hypothetical protein
MKRDLVIGMVAGLAALAAVRWWRPMADPVPPGMYQASFDQPKFREMMEILDPPQVTTRETRRRLETRLEKLAVTEVRIDWLLGYLADAGGVDIAVDWAEVRDDMPRERPVTLDLRDVTVGQAIREALAGTGALSVLSIRTEAGGVRITTQKRAERETVTRAYDLRGVIRAFRRYDHSLEVRRVPPASLPLAEPRERRLFGGGGLFAGGGALTNAAEFADFATDDLTFIDAIVRMIEELVDPTSWRDAGGVVGGIRPLWGKLIVTQTRGNQEDVAVLIEWIQHLFDEDHP